MEYLIFIFTLIAIYMILSQSLNIILGYLGLLNLGHIAFFGVGAYTTALLIRNGHSFGLSLLIGAIAAAVSGFLIGLPTLHLKQDYFGIVTLGFTFIVFSIAINWVSLTRGPLGLPGTPRPEATQTWLYEITKPLIDSQNFSFLILTIIIAITSNFLMYKILHSPFGKIIETIREDEIAAATLGKNTRKIKLLAVVLGAFFAGIAGGLFASFQQYIDPYNFVVIELSFILLMVILGGMGSFFGAIIGAFMIILLPEPLKLTGVHMLHEVILITIGIIFLLRKSNNQASIKLKIIKTLPLTLFFLTEFIIILLNDKNIKISAAGEFTPLFLITLFALLTLFKSKRERKISLYLSSIYLIALIILISTNTLFSHLPSHLIGPLRQMIFASLLIIIMIFRPGGLFGRDAIKISK